MLSVSVGTVILVGVLLISLVLAGIGIHWRHSKPRGDFVLAQSQLIHLVKILDQPVVVELYILHGGPLSCVTTVNPWLLQHPTGENVGAHPGSSSIYPFLRANMYNFSNSLFSVTVLYRIVCAGQHKVVYSTSQKLAVISYTSLYIDNIAVTMVL